MILTILEICSFMKQNFENLHNFTIWAVSNSMKYSAQIKSPKVLKIILKQRSLRSSFVFFSENHLLSSRKGYPKIQKKNFTYQAVYNSTYSEVLYWVSYNTIIILYYITLYDHFLLQKPPSIKWRNVTLENWREKKIIRVWHVVSWGNQLLSTIFEILRSKVSKILQFYTNWAVHNYTK